MPKSKYDSIYKDLKEKIVSGEYIEETFLPNNLIQIYDCSRNTIRRAISHLVDEGFLQPHHGKGVRVIYSSRSKARNNDYIATGMDGMCTAAAKNGIKIDTKVITFTDMVIDERLEAKTGFPCGTEIYFIQRVRSLDGVAKIIDTNLLRKDIANDLDRELASESLFDYFTNRHGMNITTMKRRITVERTTPFDEKHLELDEYGCLAVLTSRFYNEDGIQFEYTESRNRPDIFVFDSVMTKNLRPN